MSSQQGGQPSEEELRQAYEEEMKRISVEDILVQTVVSLVNLGGRRAGLVPGAEQERDAKQLGQALEGARALLPLVEESLGQDAGQIRQALSQLQMAYVRMVQGEQPAGAAEGGAQEPPSRPQPEPGGGPAQSGRLWIPGQ